MGKEPNIEQHSGTIGSTERTAVSGKLFLCYFLVLPGRVDT